MRYFAILYQQDKTRKLLGEDPLLWICWADDLDHAEEQLEQAEPEAIPVWAYSQDDKAPDDEMSRRVLESWYAAVEDSTRR